MLSFFEFWWDCIQVGWGLGDGVFSLVERACLIVTALAATTRLLSPKKWHLYETKILKGSTLVLVILFLTTTVVVAPFRKWENAQGKLEGSLIGRPNFVEEISGAIVTPIINQPEKGTVLSGFAVAFTNQGTHTADNIVSSLALMDQRLEGKIIGGQQISAVSTIAPNRPFETRQSFREVVKIEDSVPFYVVCQLRYRDTETKRTFKQVFFYKWNSLNSAYRKVPFDNVSFEERRKILAFLKTSGYEVYPID